MRATVTALVIALALPRLAAAPVEVVERAVVSAAVTAETPQTLGEGLTLIEPDAEPPDIYVGLRASPAEKFAARELRDYLGRITGRDLRVRFDYWLRGEPTTPWIAVGHSDLTGDIDTSALGTEQFIIEVTPDHLSIVGARDRQRGVLYGVYEVLDRLGVRWYRPEPWGEHVPRLDRIELPLGMEISPLPDYEYRSVIGGGFTRMGEHTLRQTQWGHRWAVRNRLNGSDPGGDPRHGGRFTPQFYHTYYTLVPVEEYFDEHPEYFCLYEGERRRHRPNARLRPGNPTGLQLCLGNPELQELVAQKIIAQARRCPDLAGTTFSVTPNDACPFCECAACRAMDDPEHPDLMSNRVCAFTNIIARRLAADVPGARVSLNAYSTWTDPPTIVDRLEPNVVIHIALINNWVDYTKTLEEAAPNWNHRALESFRRWHELGAAAVMTYEYWYGYGWPGPLPLTRTIADRLDHYRAYAVTGVYNDSTPHWGPQGLELYMGSRLLWDPDLDVDAELRLYYRNYYGPAAEPMQAYHEALMDAFDAHPYPVFSGGRGVHFMFTPTLIETLGGHMARARAAVEGQPLYERRLAGVYAGYEFARRVCEILRTKKREGTRVGVAGVFAGRGFYLQSDAAERQFNELVGWVRSMRGEDASFDIPPDPPYLSYLEDDLLKNAALSFMDEAQLLADFD